MQCKLLERCNSLVDIGFFTHLPVIYLFTLVPDGQLANIKFPFLPVIYTGIHAGLFEILNIVGILRAELFEILKHGTE